MKETDKRYEANRQVKLKIARALTKLMDTKAFSDISVTDIITTAGVARASYYRNFHSKEEVLIKITDDIMEEYRKRAEKLENDFFSYEAILLIFRYFKTYKKFILSVYKAGLAYIYLDLFDQELENHMGDMPYNDIHRYKVYFYSGSGEYQSASDTFHGFAVNTRGLSLRNYAAAPHDSYSVPSPVPPLLKTPGSYTSA